MGSWCYVSPRKPSPIVLLLDGSGTLGHGAAGVFDALPVARGAGFNSKPWLVGEGQRDDALPGGEHPLRNAEREFLPPMLSPRLAELHRDAFVIEDGGQSTVDLAAHRGDSSLDDLDLADDNRTETAA
jgi:hypothetical protein